MYRFNPRTREGCDALDPPRPVADQVSIHAPARGATDSEFADAHYLTFQSTHPRGVRQEREEFVLPRDEVSIHAPARGATIDPGAGTCGSLFQSTHPRGVRLARADGVDSLPPVSIHAPARGATVF